METSQGGNELQLSNQFHCHRTVISNQPAKCVEYGKPQIVMMITYIGRPVPYYPAMKLID